MSKGTGFCISMYQRMHAVYREYAENSCKEPLGILGQLPGLYFGRKADSASASKRRGGSL